jgi:hypothetical protein
MMNTKAVALAALAAFAMSALAAGSADARHRLHWRQWRVDPDFGFYRPGPAYVPYPVYDLEDEGDYYEDPPPRYSYAPDYYEPEFAPPPRKRKPVYVLRPEPAPEKPKPKLISCKKAAGIVSDYGFENVKATDCKGQSYAFQANRDGKSFTVTLNSVNGALTKVKKL